MGSRLSQKVLMVCWEGASFEIIHPLLDAGLMPNLDGLVSRGVISDLATLRPAFWPVLWNSLVTGKYAYKHGVTSCVTQIEDDGRLLPNPNSSRQCKAIWNILSENEVATSVLGWPFPSAETVHGAFVTQQFQWNREKDDSIGPLPAHSIYPKEKAGQFSQFRIHPNELTSDHIAPFVPDFAKVNQQNDVGLSILATALADTSSTHAAVTHVMETTNWEFMFTRYDMISQVARAFMQFHEPGSLNRSAEAALIYRDVVNGSYRFCDMMLGRLLELAGEDVTIILVSERGWRSNDALMADSSSESPDSLYPSHPGILVISGPNIMRDEFAWGAGLLDIVPTILMLFGLPIADDLDGRPLLQVFNRVLETDSIYSYDTTTEVTSEDSESPGLSAESATTVLEQYKAQGWLKWDWPQTVEAAERSRSAHQLTMSQVYLDAGNGTKALRLAEQLIQQDSENRNFMLHLARCYQATNAHEQCRSLLEKVTGLGIVYASDDLMMAALHSDRGEYDEALDCLFRLEQINPSVAEIHAQIGETYLKMESWKDAQFAYQRAIDIEHNCSHYHLGLSLAYLSQKEYQQSADAALEAIGLRYRLPKAHYQLGIALARMGNIRRAILAFETCLEQQSNLVQARLWLAKLYELQLDAEQQN